MIFDQVMSESYHFPNYTSSTISSISSNSLLTNTTWNTLNTTWNTMGTTSWSDTWWTTSSHVTAHVIEGANAFRNKTPAQVYPGLDIVLGIILTLCTIFGTPANVMSLMYFAFKQKSEGLLLVLYIAISCTDICICFFHIPVTALLFNGRKATFFRSVL